MPRPRSSTFYLPLAPIDAPLELKAKLSVLPPSAANALLAPRNNNHHYGGGSLGFSRSGTGTATTSCSSITINHSGSGNGATGGGGGCTPQEDECTRLNRVLGIPTPGVNPTQHTHIALPQSTSSNTTSINTTSSTSPLSNGTTSGTLGVPSSSIGRRRHTDAPKPSFPLHMTPRARPRSPLVPTPVPSESTGTGYFSSWGNADWRPASAAAASMPGTGTAPVSMPGMATAPAQTAQLPTAASELLPSLSGLSPSSLLSVSAPAPVSLPETASISDNAAAVAVPQSTLAAVVTDEANTRQRSSDRDSTEDGNGSVCETDETSMVWNATPATQHSADDMDMFASACEVQNPVVQREVDTPRASTSTSTSTSSSSSSSPNQLRRIPSPTPLASTEVERPAAPVVKPPTRLSLIPCGMHHVLACRTKVRSRFAPSPPSISRHSSRPSTAASRPSTAIHSSRPSTSSSTSSSTSTFSSTSSSPIIVLTSKVAIRPPPCDSLHPNDTRHLLRPQFRLSFPPPPAPLPLARDSHPREEACMFIDESIPGLADVDASFVPTTNDDSDEAELHYASEQSTAKVAPRQRFRLAPLYLPKVLRRSIGATAWARQETLRAARAAERGFGWGAAGPGGVCSSLSGAVPLNFNTGAGAWPSAFTTDDPGAWWQSGSNGQSSGGGGDFSSSLVWSGYEDVYSEEADEDMEMQEDDGGDDDDATRESVWDWEDEDVEPVMVQGQERHQESMMMMDEDEFVREGAPEPEERPSPSDYSPQSSPSYSVQTPSTPLSEEATGYSMVGKFGWDTTWPTSPTSPISPGTGQTKQFQSIDIPALDVTPITLGLPPVHRRTARREDGAVEEEDEEEIFRYSPLKVEEDHAVHRGMDVEGDEEVQQVHYLHTQSTSSCSTPTATSPSFPPGQLRGVTISSSFDEGYLSGTSADAGEEFYDADGDAEMEEAPARNVIMSRPPIRAPRPLSIVQHPVLHHQYRVDSCSPPPSSVFIIPPSPLTTTTFDAGSGTGSSTPTSATAPTFPDLMEEEGDLSNVGWPTASVEHTLSPRRSYERIIAPRPQRVSRALEQVFTASTSSPVYRTSALAQSPPPGPGSPPSSSSSPRIPSASSPRWTFGSLKSALSNSMSHLVELARSRSPSPLPWLMRGSAGYTSSTLSGVAAALDSHRRDGSEEELESERSTGCVTPTPAGGSHSRRSSTTTITDATSRRADSSSSAGHLPVLKLQVDPTSADAMMSESPPPKRTLSTSSLSSLGSEPDSESGSSGGIFSRSPSPEPTSETRIWDPSYTLTPRSRPISADAKAAAACGGRLSPMMIPGSWDPAELWAEEGDLAKTW